MHYSSLIVVRGGEHRELSNLFRCAIGVFVVAAAYAAVGRSVGEEKRLRKLLGRLCLNVKLM